MNKKILFISHISEEANLAKYIKSFINEKFLGSFDIFVSSDGNSIEPGSTWKKEIENALKKSSIQISLCSHESIRRPWINFEAGASWIREIPAVPICHSGLKKIKLPAPLSMLQSCDIDNVDDLQDLFHLFAKTLDINLPVIDFPDFIDNCATITKNYNLRYEIRKSVSKISEFLPDVSKCLMGGEPMSISFECRDTFLKDFMESIKIFQDNQYVSLSSSGTTHNGKIGNMFSQKIQLELLPDYESVRSEIFGMK